MGTISLVGWVLAESFTNSSSRSTSNRSTLPSFKSCACSMCVRSTIRVTNSMDDGVDVYLQYLFRHTGNT